MPHKTIFQEVILMTHLVQGAKIVSALIPQATNANPASTYVDVANCHKLFIAIHVTKGNAALTSFAIEQATSSAGAGNKVLANTIPVWVNLDTSAATGTDTLVRQANAISYALNNEAGGVGQMVIFELDPSKLDINNGFRWVRFQVAAGNANNIASAVYYLVDHRYKQATPPSAV